MKKLYFFLTMAIAFAVVSCSKDQTEVTTASDDLYADYSVMVALDSNSAAYTRATDEGGLSNVDEHNVRFIMAVYDENGEDLLNTSYQIVAPDASSVTFEARLLLNETYRFVYWADFVTEATAGVQKTDDTTAADLYYNTADLTNISFKGTYAGNEEARDAYTATQQVTILPGTLNTSVTLVRPFGKMRVAAADIPNGMDYVPNSVTVTYNAGLYTSFNAVEQEAGAAQTTGQTSYTYELPANTDWEEIQSVGSVLAWDYFLPNGSISFTLSTTDGTNTTSRLIEGIPVAKNKLTTVSGNILTGGATVTVTVDDDFEGTGTSVELTEVSTVAALAQALANGFTNITLTTPLAEDTTISIPQSFYDGAAVTINVTSAGNDLNVVENATGGGSFPANITLNFGTAGSVDINTPNSTVTYTGTATNVTATTASSTLIVAEGAHIDNLTVMAGNVVVYGDVDILTRDASYNGIVTWYVSDKTGFDQAAIYADVIGITETTVDLGDTAYQFTKGITIKGMSSQSVIDGAISSTENLVLSNLTITGTANPIVNTAGALDATGVTVIQNKVGTGGTTITAASSAVTAGGVINMKDCVINLNVTAYAWGVNAYSDVTLDNCTFFTASEAKDENAVSSRGINIFGVNTTATIKNSSFTGFYYPFYTNKAVTGITANVTNSTLKGYGAFNIWGANGTYNITGSKLIGNNIYSGVDDGYGVVVLNTEASGAEITLTDTELISISTQGAPEYSIDVRVDDVTLNLAGRTSLTDTSKTLDSMIRLDDETVTINPTLNVGADVTYSGKDGVVLIKEIIE